MLNELPNVALECLDSRMHQFATRLCYQQYRWSLTNRYVLSRILELWHCRLRLCCKLVSFTVYNLILLHTAFAAAWNQRALLLYGDLSVDNCTASHQECETIWNTDVRHLYYYYLITGTLTEDRLQTLCRFYCCVVSANWIYHWEQTLPKTRIVNNDNFTYVMIT